MAESGPPPALFGPDLNRGVGQSQLQIGFEHGRHGIVGAVEGGGNRAARAGEPEPLRLFPVFRDGDHREDPAFAQRLFGGRGGLVGGQGHRGRRVDLARRLAGRRRVVEVDPRDGEPPHEAGPEGERQHQAPEERHDEAGQQQAGVAAHRAHFMARGAPDVGEEAGGHEKSLLSGERGPDDQSPFGRIALMPGRRPSTGVTGRARTWKVRRSEPEF